MSGCFVRPPGRSQSHSESHGLDNLMAKREIMGAFVHHLVKPAATDDPCIMRSRLDSPGGITTQHGRGKHTEFYTESMKDLHLLGRI